jgi:YaiO family outer membrane protein
LGQNDKDGFCAVGRNHKREIKSLNDMAINGIFKLTATLMPRKPVIRAVLSIVVYLTLAFQAQVGAQSFEEARNYAFNGDREKARSICRQILAEGFNSDVALLMGRTFAWDSQYDSARAVLLNVLFMKPGNMEALDALSDVEYWSDNDDKAIEYCNKALEIDPLSGSFALKKARILYGGEQYEQAVDVLESYLKKDPGNVDFIKKLMEYRPDMMKNSIRLSYTIDFFDKDFNRDPWQITSLSYGRKTKLGSVISRLNYANRFGGTGYQFEIDAYPKIGENNYAYVNYGYSQNSLFPKNRFGAELYHNFPRAFEGSIGMRYLSFSESKVDIYTATFGKYVGNYWLSFRTYVTPDSDGTSVSGSLTARRYFADAENYIGIRAGYGISPDDNRNPLVSEKLLTVKTRSVRAEFNHIFKRVWILNAGTVLGSEQLEPGIFSGYYTFDISIQRLF